MQLRNYQKSCIDSLENDYHKSVVNMWCGTGKTRIFTHYILSKKYDINVLVFPSLALINQYNVDYILNNENVDFQEFTFLSFCSDNKRKISEYIDRINYDKIIYTTSETQLKKYLKSKKKKIISVTYQSFNTFTDFIKENNYDIDVIIYDEAHHILSNLMQDIVFDEHFEDCCKKIF